MKGRKVNWSLGIWNQIHFNNFKPKQKIKTTWIIAPRRLERRGNASLRGSDLVKDVGFRGERKKAIAIQYISGVTKGIARSMINCINFHNQPPSQMRIILPKD